MKQVALSANTGTSSQALVQDNGRCFMYIRNYAGSAGTLWVAFGQAATAGMNGELELPPGQDKVFGSNYLDNPIAPPFSNNCPKGSVNVISSAGTATGCLLVNSLPSLS